MLSPNSLTLYSFKVFVGGLPKGTNERHIRSNFWKHGVSDIEYAKRENACYCFLIFKNELSVQKFIASLGENEDGRLFAPFLKDMFSKPCMVEVKPFKLMDAHFGYDFNANNLQARSVFIGGVPRDTTAEMLAMKLETQFGAVDEVNIDLDAETMYPRGTAIVTFKSASSASKAIWSQTMIVNRQHRVVELKPFLTAHQQCSVCEGFDSAVYCPTCMHIMCDTCWEIWHMISSDGQKHQKITRGTFYTPRRRSN